jgi:FkbM family methyltransferase
MNRLGYDIRRFVADQGPHINVLELAVRDALSRSDDFFFLQVGANDGKMDDPLRPLIVKHRLRGLLVEPLPDCFAALRRNFADQPQLLFENCALGARDGEQELFRVHPGAYPEAGIQGMAGFSKEVILRHRSFFPGLEKNIDRLSVPTMTFASLAHKHALRKLDLVVVDTEGYDFEILKMVFGGGMRPNIVSYEHIHLSPADQVACREMLIRQGYSFASTRRDTVALLAT